MSQSHNRPADTTIYRVSRIPSRFDRIQLLQVITQVLELNDASGIKLHSLASDIPDGEEPPLKTATVSFSTRPARLSPSITKTWSFESVSEEDDPYEEQKIYFDTHFLGFTPLSSSADEIADTVDCIVVHGWGGHALGSFRSTNSPYTWIRDCLPKRFRQLRIWTYGYDSKLTEEVSIIDVDDHADSFRWHLRRLRKKTKANQKVTPIIFIVHSLGGWIFQKATVEMGNSDDKNDHLTLASIYGALYFGVPNQGMNVTAMANMIEDLPGSFTLKQLDEGLGFRLRQRQHEEFCRIFCYRDSKIVKFFEQMKSPTVCWDDEQKRWARNGKKEKLVSPESATYGRDWERGGDYVIAINGDHSTMVKFVENDPDLVGKVCDRLETFLIEAPEVIAVRLIPGTSETVKENSLAQVAHRLSSTNVSVEEIVKAENLSLRVKPSANVDATSMVVFDKKQDILPLQKQTPVEAPAVPKPVIHPITMSLPRCEFCNVKPASFPVYTCDNCMGKTVLCVSCVRKGALKRYLVKGNLLLGMGQNLFGMYHSLSHKIRPWESGVWYPMSMWSWAAGENNDWAKLTSRADLKLGDTPIPQERADMILYNPRPKVTQRLAISPTVGTYKIRFQFTHGQNTNFKVSSLSKVKGLSVPSLIACLTRITFMVAKTRNISAYINNIETPAADQWNNRITYDCPYIPISYTTSAKLPQPVTFEAGEALAIWVEHERSGEGLSLESSAVWDDIGFWWRLEGLSLEKHGLPIVASTLKTH